MSYLDAKNQCESDGTRLAVPSNDAEHNFLVEFLKGQHMWIGVNHIDNEGHFVTVDGSNLTYTNWMDDAVASFPNSAGDVKDGIKMNHDDQGRWLHQRIESIYKFVCMDTQDFIDTRGEKPSEEYLIADNTWGRSYYKIYNEHKNYRDAEVQCVTDGAHLAIPRSNDENNFIAGLIPNKRIWIGINDIDAEGIYVTVDGSGRDLTFFMLRTLFHDLE